LANKLFAECEKILGKQANLPSSKKTLSKDFAKFFCLQSVFSVLCQSIFFALGKELLQIIF